jgi:hypothetical protein
LAEAAPRELNAWPRSSSRDPKHPREAGFDRIVGTMAALFGVQIADDHIRRADRSWYKAELGMGVSEMPRTDNMCDATMSQEAVLVINDASSRHLQACHCLRRNAILRGAQLSTRDGTKIGTLCAVDPHPREVTDRERLILLHLAEIVIDEPSCTCGAEDGGG